MIQCLPTLYLSTHPAPLHPTPPHPKAALHTLPFCMTLKNSQLYDKRHKSTDPAMKHLYILNVSIIRRNVHAHPRNHNDETNLTQGAMIMNVQVSPRQALQITLVHYFGMRKSN